MYRRHCLRLGLLLLAAILLAACGASQGPEGPVGPAGPAGPPGPPGPQGEAATASQNYVGAAKCGGCHETIYATFQLSGHPHKLTKVVDGQPPAFPYDDQTGGIPAPPDGYTWDEVSYVIGGFAWKARFIDSDGYIITGDESATTQYNFANEAVGTDAQWVAYHAGEQVPYDCGACHTTGYRPEGHQDDLPGIVGTWAEDGIQCEECHGPGSRHAEDPYGVGMVVDRSAQLCGDCHIRGNPSEIDASNGFIRHHEQYEELFNSQHFALDCITCHDPHASTVFSDEELNPERGLRQDCDTCHWQQTFQKVRFHRSMQCTDCHMPPAGKSATADLDTFTGDISSHLFAINPDPDAPQFNEEGALASPYITLDYACRHCHNGEFATEKEDAELADMAAGYHTPPTPTPEPPAEPEAEEGEATPTPES